MAVSSDHKMTTCLNISICIFLFVQLVLLTRTHGFPIVIHAAGDEDKLKPKKLPPLSAACDASLSNSSEKKGKYYDACMKSVDCKGNQKCVAIMPKNEEFKISCEEGMKDQKEREKRCLCIPQDLRELFKCEGEDKCGEGQGCGFRNKPNGEIVMKQPFCVSNEMNFECYRQVTAGLSLEGKGPEESAEGSPEVSETPQNDGTGGNGEGVCIGTKHLGEFNQDELVFDEHQMANVLCDNAGSCATPGHIVIWEGQGIMMKTYCNIVGGCTREKMTVNSPKWKAGRRIKSDSEGLSFSVYAARYESNVEESVLKSVVRMEMWSLGN